VMIYISDKVKAQGHGKVKYSLFLFNAAVSNVVRAIN